MPPEETTVETTVETPEETPTEETPPKDSSSPQSDSIEVLYEEPDFSAIAEFVEKDGEAETPTVEAVEEEREVHVEEEETLEEVPTETVKEESEGEETTEKLEEKKVEAKEEKEETPVEEATEFKLPTKEELDGMYTEHRKETLPILEKLFSLTDEEAAALDEQPSKVLPKLAGSLMYDTMLSTYNAVLVAMPSVVNRIVAASNQAQKAEAQFFDAWPDLRSPAAKPVVSAAITAYRAAHPRATLEDVISKAGVMAMINAGFDPTQKKKEAEKLAAPVEKKTPAKPAGARSTTQVVPPKKKEGRGDGNIFAEIAEAYAEELR